MKLLWILVISLNGFLTHGKIIRLRHEPPPIDSPLNRADQPVWANITQRVDHFNPLDKRNWTMRYIYNNAVFQSGGPIFIYLGGEWSISTGSLTSGAVYDLASEHNGYMFYTEHRYYGQSFPLEYIYNNAVFQSGGPIFIYLGGEWTISTGRLTSGTVYDLASEHNGYMFYTEHRYYGQSFPLESLSLENLKYLSADQALADIAYFIQYQKETMPELQNSSVVVIGGSYSATLATWARIKYPHLVDIAYSSSGPLNAKPDFYEYYEVITENLGLVSSTCPAVIESAIAEIEEMLETEEGIGTVSTLFNTCQTLNISEPHRAFFFNSLGEVFAGVVQYASDGDIEYTCSQIENANETTNMEKLASYIREYNGDDCISSYDEFLEAYTSTDLTTDIYRQWIYQTCTEYGWFQTTTSNYQAFRNTFSIDLFYQMCKDLFGEGYDNEVTQVGSVRTNVVYGADEPEITRLIAVQGTVDPWHPPGILHDLNPLAIAIVVNGASHCADLSSIRDNDSDEMREAKLRVRATIADWLQEIRGEATSSGPKNNITGIWFLMLLMFLKLFN